MIIDLQELVDKVNKNDCLHIILDFSDMQLSPSELKKLSEAMHNNTKIRNIIWGTQDSITEDDKHIIDKIEQKVISNLLDYRSSPPDHLMYLLSSEVYRNLQLGEIINFPTRSMSRWVVKKIFEEKESRYYSAILSNSDECKMVLVNRGTDPTRLAEDLFINKDSPIHTDFRGVVASEYTLAHNEAFSSIMKSYDISKINGYDLSTTGHSLGAHLAELQACYLYVEKSAIIRTTTFESPGHSKMIAKLNDQELRKCTKNSLRIKSYSAHPNLINTFDGHEISQHFLLPYKIEDFSKSDKFEKIKKDYFFWIISILITKEEYDTIIKIISSINEHSLSTLLALSEDEAYVLYNKAKIINKWPKNYIDFNKKYNHDSCSQSLMMSFFSKYCGSIFVRKDAGICLVFKHLDMLCHGQINLRQLLSYLEKPAYCTDEIEKEYISYEDMHHTSFIANCKAVTHKPDEGELNSSESTIDETIIELYENHHLIEKCDVVSNFTKKQINEIIQYYNLAGKKNSNIKSKNSKTVEQIKDIIQEWHKFNSGFVENVIPECIKIADEETKAAKKKSETELAMISKKLSNPEFEDFLNSRLGGQGSAGDNPLDTKESTLTASCMSLASETQALAGIDSVDTII